MNKKIIYPLIMLMCLLLVSGCLREPSAVREEHKGHPALAGTREGNPQPVEPPLLLTFGKMDDYFDFVRSAELPEDEFVSFMKRNGHYVSGRIETKEDLEKILTLSERVRLPQSEDFVAESMVIYHEYPDKNWYITCRGSAGQGINYYFFPGKDPNVSVRDVLAKGKRTDAVPVDLGEQSDLTEVYYLGKAIWPTPEGMKPCIPPHIFLAKTGDCIVQCRLHLEKDVSECIDILKSFSFEALPR